MPDPETMLPCADPRFEAEVDRIEASKFSQHWSLEQSQDYCRSWAKKQYENFSVASWLIPRQLRQDFYNVYAYCRWSDNLADEISNSNRSLELLDAWGSELEVHSEAKHPILIALSNTIARHSLPLQPFRDLLIAFRQDQTVLRYANDAELLNYCRNSANPVGRILLGLASANSPENDALSDRICSGLQIANFCQDMSRDAQQGRIYAPRQRWEQHGVKESEILRGERNESLQGMLGEWASYARGLLESGLPLAESVPSWLAVDVRLFAGGGLTILDEIARANFDVWTSRPTVSKWQKVRLLASAWLARSRPQGSPHGATPLPNSKEI
ncbi:MAG: squalene synthase HpnC [Pirellulaceae bacterium]